MEGANGTSINKIGRASCRERVLVVSILELEEIVLVSKEVSFGHNGLRGWALASQSRGPNRWVVV